MTHDAPLAAEPPIWTPTPRWKRWLVLAVALAALVGGGFFVWDHFLKEQFFFPRKWGVVDPGEVFRSGQISRRLIRKTLVDHHIKMIVCLDGDNADDADCAAEKKAAASLGVQRVVYNLAGTGTGNINYYVGAITHIVEAKRHGEPVLVHCASGSQRTGGVVACYEMLVEHRPADQAYAQMLEFGHVPRENPQLVPYLNQHMRELAEKLVKAGAIDRVPRPLPVIGRD